MLGTVEARLDAEGSDAKRVLRAASVFGDRFSAAAVASLLGGEVHRRDVAGWLDALAAHELVAPAGAARASGDADYVFRHTLVREAAYAMLTEDDRTLGHRLAGEWLEQHGSADATAMAEHFRRGGEPARSVRWYRRAAEQALDGERAHRRHRARRGAASPAAPRARSSGSCAWSRPRRTLWRGELATAEERGLEAIGLLAPASPALVPRGRRRW